MLSLGLVKLNGEELYLELEPAGETSDWAKEKILPFLKGPKINRATAIKMVKDFLGPDQPYLVAYVNQFDTVYLYKLLNIKESTKNLSFNWIILDFASMLFAWGFDPEVFSSKNKEKFCEQLGIDRHQYQEHQALDDARLLREVYLKLITRMR